MAQFSIPTRKIGESDSQFEFPIPHSWLSATLEGTDVRAPTDGPPGKLAIRIYRSGPDYLVGGSATARLVVGCSRCLEDIVIPVETELSLVLSAGSQDESADSELELSSDDLGREFFSGDDIVLDAIIRDHLLLELPMQPICVDPPCPEWVHEYLTTAEEAKVQEEENRQRLDPRLAPLARLKKENGDDTN